MKKSGNMKPFMVPEQIEILAEYPEWLPRSRCIIGITNIGRVLGTSNIKTIYYFINKMNLPVYIAPIRRHRYIPVCELLQWLDQHGQKTYQLSEQVRQKYSKRMKNNKIASKKSSQTDNVYIREK